MTIHRFNNAELGLRADVYESDADCRVVLVDTDANAEVAAVRIYRATELDRAIDYAKLLVS